MKCIQTEFVLHMGLLIGLVAGGTYASTSGLFAVYLASACIAWLDKVASFYRQ